jgi:hypothetical protein
MAGSWLYSHLRNDDSNHIHACFAKGARSEPTKEDVSGRLSAFLISRTTAPVLKNFVLDIYYLKFLCRI